MTFDMVVASNLHQAPRFYMHSPEKDLYVQGFEAKSGLGGGSMTS